MFNIYTDHPFHDDSAEGCGYEDWRLTKDFVLANCSKYKNPQFIETINTLGKELSILDIGCGTGMVVEDLLLSGHKACGVDGLYTYKKYLPTAWNNIPFNLFTCDIGKDFTISYHEYGRFDKNPHQFDIITTSEFLEHLRPEEVDTAISNISKHLKENGILIAEISEKHDGGHYSIHPADWWIKEFKKINLIEDSELNNKFGGKYYRNIETSHKFCFRKTS